MRKVISAVTAFLVLAIIGAFAINIFVTATTKDRIVHEEQAFDSVDCILVLGAGVVNNKPSHMLEDRLLKAVELYEKGASGKIIMSGDHGSVQYDEVNIMKEFAIKKGIASEKIFMDHAGFSTYESMYRAKHIFHAEKVIVVTQKYHLYRALYIAKKLGLDAYGVAAEDVQYSGTSYRELREILARVKDFIKCIFKPAPTYLGDAIPISGDGNVTNDKN